MRVKGFTITPTDPDAERAALFRFYGTRETVTDDAGEERPHPNRWSLVREVRALVDGAAYTLPDFDLPRTEPGRWRFFFPVVVMPDGREVWHADAEITFPRACVETFDGDVSFAGLLLWNLERKGHVAPGQLLD
jgi:hypothetical protein